MEKYLFHQRKGKKQYILSIAAVTTVALLGLLLHNLVGYRVVAFMLLVTVSILAMFLDIAPVLLAALLSAVFWNFLFIPPRFTLTVGTPEDRMLLLMYFIIAMINAGLTHKIRQMEKEVQAKDERAKSINFYNTLLYSLSHDLRTPITTILGSTDNLLNNAKHLSEKDKQDLLGEISLASMRLNQSIENLLNMSRLEAGFFQIKKDWCDISDLIHKALNGLSTSLQNYNVKVTIPEHFPLFKLDFGLMEQVIHNLVLNVTRHTPEGTSIMIDAEHIGNKLVITIADSGKGFPPDEIDKAFDKFYRIKGASPGSTGLGLSIVKGFTEAHGGTVRLRNLPLVGSQFTIEIPAEISPVSKVNDDES